MTLKIVAVRVAPPPLRRPLGAARGQRVELPLFIEHRILGDLLLRRSHRIQRKRVHGAAPASLDFPARLTLADTAIGATDRIHHRSPRLAQSGSCEVGCGRPASAGQPVQSMYDPPL